MSRASLGALMIKHYVSSEESYHRLELHILLRNHKEAVFISLSCRTSPIYCFPPLHPKQIFFCPLVAFCPVFELKPRGQSGNSM